MTGVSISHIEIPPGLSAEQLQRAVECVQEWEQADGESAAALVIQLYSILHPVVHIVRYGASLSRGVTAASLPTQNKEYPHA